MSSKIKYRTEKHAPDGGWGWCVAIGLTIPFACYMGNIHSFGLMFNEFLANLGAETGAVTLVIACYFSSQSFSSLFASALFRKFSIRSVGLFGATFYFLGLFLCVFINSTEMLAFSFGILNGFGLGCIMTAGYSCFNLYFVKRRIFMMSLLQASKGVLVALYPLLVKTLMNMYGYRGAMAIIAAINAHAIVGMLVLHPIEWHYKVVKVPEIELKSLLKKKPIDNEPKENNGSDSDSALHKISIEKPEEISISHQLIERSMQRRLDKKLIRSKSFGDPVDPKDFLSIQKRIESVMSLDDLSGDGMVIARTETPQTGVWQKLVDLFDLTLFKDWIYVNIVFGISFAQFSDNTLISLLPMYLETLGFSMDDAALIVSTGTVADFAARIGLALLSAFFPLEPRYIYLAGAMGFLITRFIFLYTFSFSGMLVIAVFLGIFRTLIHVPVSLIYAGHLPPERFAAGYGLFMFFQGNLMFLLGPIVGWLRDKTQSYVLLVYCLQFFMSLCVIPWIIEIVWLRVKARKSNG